MITKQSQDKCHRHVIYLLTTLTYYILNENIHLRFKVVLCDTAYCLENV